MNVPKVNYSKPTSRIITSRSSISLKKTEITDSVKKPLIRKTSNFEDRNALKRRTYSLKDKEGNNITNPGMQEVKYKEKCLESFDKDNINFPEKDSSDSRMKTDESTLPNESLNLTDRIKQDSFDNIKFANYPKHDENMEVDDETNDSDEPTIIENIKSSEKKNNVKKSISKSNPTKDFSPLIKMEKSKFERKAVDPSKVNEEMKRNYENEIAVLKKQLQQGGLQANPTEDALLSRCNMLESQLRKSQNEAESMTEQVKGLRTQLQTWPNRVRELEDENETMRGRVEDVRVINQQRQNEISELHEIVKNLESKLWEQSSGSNRQEKIFLQRLMSEYDHLLKEYDAMKMNNMTNERKLYEARTRINEITSKLSEYEINLRKLESENSSLKKRINTEQTYGSAKYRGWDRNQVILKPNNVDQNYQFRNGLSVEVSPQPSPKPPVDTAMMSLSCYGALPSYGELRDDENSGLSGRRFEYDESRANEEYTQNDLSQSVYLHSQNDNKNISTPTNERRRVSILEKVKYRNNPLKETAPSFEDLRHSPVDLMTQSMSRPINDIHGYPQASRRRPKPGGYDRDSWAESKTEEEKELERHYDQLQNEKKQLLTNLSHIPTNSTARNRRANREQRECLEAQLDHIDRQLGLMRMQLKQKNII